MDDDDVWDAQMATVLEQAEAAALRDKVSLVPSRYYHGRV